MIRRSTVFNSIVFVTLATVGILLRYPAEARLGRASERQLAPEPLDVYDSQAIKEATQSSGSTTQAFDRQRNETPADDSEEQCTVPCTDGSHRIAVCHARAGSFVQICTEMEAFGDHVARGDRCGLCITSES
mmetsp:Transcript_9520/g.28377  ORF Transcript_9520/g.28377 Transcript_9520/m.28377 type:complete len:132 (-) Transcript_9520:506-901(-)